MRFSPDSLGPDPRTDEDIAREAAEVLVNGISRMVPGDTVLIERHSRSGSTAMFTLTLTKPEVPRI